ncbi:MAG: hypothetical protein JWL95_96, partial [Gemmatimonadetes bacterium]|nr:hypothetical protein [Gemmatimonadota bacterium]
MRSAISLQNVLVGVSALLFAGAHFMPDRDRSGPVLTAAVAFVAPKPAASSATGGVAMTNALSAVTTAALDAFS